MISGVCREVRPKSNQIVKELTSSKESFYVKSQGNEIPDLS
jgi:hypothetical protein